jgi:dihydroorotate dehydrogenase (fumarate)
VTAGDPAPFAGDRRFKSESRLVTARIGIAQSMAVDLTTRYLGLTLPHPIVCGASPLSADLAMVLRLEDAGAAAIVMHSLFEEQILKDAMRRPHLGRESHTRTAVDRSPTLNAYTLSPGQYLEHLLRVKSRVRIPIVASLNGTTPEGWLQYARAVERAGADALELNFYHVAIDPAETGQTIEQRLIDTVAVVKQSVSIPVTVKLSPFYSSVPNIAARLEHIGADGLVLFNRFYQADIDPVTHGATVSVQLSDSSDLLLRLHAIAILSGRVRLSLAVSGGVHEPADVVKAVLAGADVVQITSTLLRHGPPRLTYLRTQLEEWGQRQACDSLAAVKGVASLACQAGLSRFERDEYVSVLQSWNPDHLRLPDS